MLIEKGYETQSKTICENLTLAESIQVNSSFSLVEHNGSLNSEINDTFQLSSDLSAKVLSSPAPPTPVLKRSI